MRIVFGILLSLVALTVPVSAQSATVTFYSVGSLLKADARQTVTLEGQMPLLGWIFDDDQRLTYLEPGRFLSIQLPVGLHTFAAGLNSKHAAKNASLPIQLEKDRRYCIRLALEYKTYIVLDTHTGILDPVGCEAARREAQNAEPVEIKHVQKSERGILVAPSDAF